MISGSVTVIDPGNSDKLLSVLQDVILTSTCLTGGSHDGTDSTWLDNKNLKNYGKLKYLIRNNPGARTNNFTLALLYFGNYYGFKKELHSFSCHHQLSDLI